SHANGVRRSLRLRAVLAVMGSGVGRPGFDRGGVRERAQPQGGLVVGRGRSTGELTASVVELEPVPRDAGARRLDVDDSCLPVLTPAVVVGFEHRVGGEIANLGCEALELPAPL